MVEKKLIEIERAGDDDIALQRLLYRKLDGILVMKNVGLYYLKRLSPSEQKQITYSTRPHGTFPLHLIISRKVEGSKELVRLFNEGLSNLVKSKRLDEILATYILDTN